MGPDNNRALFIDVAQPRLEALGEEYLRRNLLSPALEELSVQFESQLNTSHEVVEPTMIARLYALSQVQRTFMGIAGFNPLNTINSQEGAVEAKAAPAHDEFTLDGGTYKTRIIRFTFPDLETDTQIDVFGINVFQPDTETGAGVNGEDEVAESGGGLLIVGLRGEVKESPNPITGETVLFAVRNKSTGDSKLYKVSYVDEETIIIPPIGTIIHHNPKYATVKLPDGTLVDVKQLDGELQREAVQELQDAVRVLAEQPNPVLDEKEREGVASVLGTTGS